MSAADLHRIADALLSLRPGWVLFSGGEPLLVRELFGLARRFVEAGVQTVLYTSGWTLAAGVPAELPRVFNRVQVSLDGPDAATHDRIRGRVHSFDRAMRGLRRLDETAPRSGPAAASPTASTRWCCAARSAPSTSSARGSRRSCRI
jgi:sulfatase maturation enzyme AslB (radical SAM superfamily)